MNYVKIISVNIQISLIDNPDPDKYQTILR
jgi:hypothetical protein